MSIKVSTTQELTDALQSENNITITKQINIKWYTKNNSISSFEEALKQHNITIQNSNKLNTTKVDRPSYHSPLFKF